MGLFRLLILLGLGYLLFRLVKRLTGPPRERPQEGTEGVVDEMVQDPECKTFIPKHNARRRLVQGEAYYFCSQKCADQFEERLTDKT
jgi:YHS domain-containing protein